MTHIMVPDGVLPAWLWIGGWVLAALCIGLAIWSTRDSDRTRQIPLAGVIAAVMTIAMSFEIIPIAYEPHLTVLAGILLGPAYGFLATFVFNILRLLLGDGALTLLGLNSVLLGAEAVVGFYLFRLFTRVRPTKPSSAGVVAAAATFASLAISTLLFLGIVAVGLADLQGLDLGEEVLERAGADPEHAGFLVFAQFVLLLGAIGWLIESVLTGAIVAFLLAVRPSMVTEPVRR